MESNYKLAEMIQARINTRETSTLTIATVAASASLVLLALSASPGSYNDITHHSWLRLGGFLFALLGILYRETTILTVDTKDYAMLNRISSYLMSDKTERGEFARGFILRALLLSSLAAWSNLLFHSLENIGASLLGVNWFPAVLPFLFWSVFLPALFYGKLWHRLLAFLAALGAFLIAYWLFFVLVSFPQVVISTDVFALTGGSYVVLATVALTWIGGRNQPLHVCGSGGAHTTTIDKFRCFLSAPT